MYDLKDISGYCQLIANSIAEAFDVDITIVNHGLIRIAGTGDFRKTIGQRVPAGVLSEVAMAKKESFIVDHPRLCHHCSRCTKHDCDDAVVFISPIIKDSCVIGIIDLTSKSEEHKNDLLKKRKKMMDYIKMMGNLLLTKLEEKYKTREMLILNNQLDAIINSVNEGIIATDKDKKITKVNRFAEQILFVKGNSLVGKPIDYLFPNKVVSVNNSYDNKEVRFRNKHRQIHLICSAKKIYSENQESGMVFIFKDISQVRKFVYEMTANKVYTFDDIAGVSPELEKTKDFARRVARSDSIILIRGETGTGKEMFARAIHEASARKAGPFIPINCSAIPESLLESEFFGYDEGAFTGAKSGGKPGKLEMANHGTLFLDEIGDMPLYLQGKLLRVIEEKSFMRLGSIKLTSVNVRIIAATNRNLESLIEEGEFRSDLFFRLNVIPVTIPPLRERLGDIEFLLNYFLSIYTDILRKHIKGFSDEAIKILNAYSWPGNVRELQNLVELLVNLEIEEYISAVSIPDYLKQPANGIKPKNTIKSLKHIENEMLTKAMEKYGTSKDAKGKIAKALGLSKSSVYRKLKQYNIE